ncbi:hypothetical protein ACF09H_40925, partial [Streptomyces sp. NPDC014983]|uniref:hypothetical protein n=1 Tax=Streptomyces sp. NPDC014983 TaxID=3364933 RepID=UPI0037025CEC
MESASIRYLKIERIFRSAKREVSGYQMHSPGEMTPERPPKGAKRLSWIPQELQRNSLELGLG